MPVKSIKIEEGQRYRHRWTGALVRIKKLRDDATVFWQALDDYRIEGHSWGVMQAVEFAEAFDLIGMDYGLGKVG